MESQDDAWTAEVRRERWQGMSDKEWLKARRLLQRKLEHALEMIDHRGYDSSDEDEDEGEDEDEDEEADNDAGDGNSWETIHGRVTLDNVDHYITHGGHQEGGGYVYFRKDREDGIRRGAYRWTRQWEDAPTYKDVAESNKMLIYTCNCLGRQMFKLVSKGYRLKANELDFETYIEEMYDKN